MSNNNFKRQQFGKLKDFFSLSRCARKMRFSKILFSNQNAISYRKFSSLISFMKKCTGKHVCISSMSRGIGLMKHRYISKIVCKY